MTAALAGEKDLAADETPVNVPGTGPPPMPAPEEEEKDLDQKEKPAAGAPLLHVPRVRGHRGLGVAGRDRSRPGLGARGRLPTERQLAADMSVSRSDVRNALAVLEAEGKVSREVGRGTFLAVGTGQSPCRPPGSSRPSTSRLPT